jgi:hypothetical protein
MGFTQPLTEMSSRSRALQVRDVDSLTVIRDPIVKTVWDPQHHNPTGIHCPLQGYHYLFICR